MPGVSDDRPGLELAGEVAEAGEGVTAWRPGDRVMAISTGEGQAEYAVVHILRFEAGWIVELWDLVQEIAKDSPNAAGMF